MNLTQNFTLEEFEYSNTAIENNIINKANNEVVYNLKELCNNLLEPLRDKLNKPIIVTSGYRCFELNKIVGGVSKSQHLEGKAADIIVKDLSTEDLFHFIKNNFKFDQLIIEHIKGKNWVHVSWDGANNRNNSLRIG
ncbi:D-Ala-D-Ala carboxypeptidase family metallohydrolase [Silvanigrella sp.]|jgi:zinc D-Ala-D-Ala carboxypeptidase|uniref:D-Ala-D-Ala carboxypeptidase family metallohydrolase n=1 Tax=Silvanigrella sp. TaxID=2024976 RepID=UPI0037CC4FC5